MKLRGLYAITPEGIDGALLLQKVRAALEGRIALLQYRRKRGNPAEAKEILSLARAFGVPMIVNDDVELALEIGADGVHVGRDDPDVFFSKSRLQDRIVGVSCYNDLERAQAAVSAGADYVAFGSVFASPTKPAAVRAPLALFEHAKDLGIPLAAIGGITLRNAHRIVAAGADLLAVISDLFDAPDIRARASDYRKLFT